MAEQSFANLKYPNISDINCDIFTIVLSITYQLSNMFLQIPSCYLLRLLPCWRSQCRLKRRRSVVCTLGRNNPQNSRWKSKKPRQPEIIADCILNLKVASKIGYLLNFLTFSYSVRKKL